MATPGPWIFDERRKTVQIGDVECGGVYHGAVTDVIADADLRVISAAPDMLAALKQTVPVLEAVQRIFVRYGLDGGRTLGGPLNDIINAALAKAEAA